MLHVSCVQKVAMGAGDHTEGIWNWKRMRVAVVQHRCEVSIKRCKYRCIDVLCHHQRHLGVLLER
jgi:hypothetical protein